MSKQPVQLKVKKLDPRAHKIQRATDGAACFDVHAIDVPGGEVSLQPGQTIILRTGLAFEIPKGYKMNVFSRSGQGIKSDVRLANCTGIIDNDYRGEVMVKLTRDMVTPFDRATTAEPFIIREGDRICQAELQEVIEIEFISVDDLSETARGEGGFGSTGTSAQL